MRALTPPLHHCLEKESAGVFLAAAVVQAEEEEEELRWIIKEKDLYTADGRAHTQRRWLNPSRNASAKKGKYCLIVAKELLYFDIHAEKHIMLIIYCAYPLRKVFGTLNPRIVKNLCYALREIR